MRVDQWLSRALVLTLLGLGGCPAVLDDNFTSVPREADAGDSGAAARGATAGFLNGGAPDTGGTPTAGGMAGKTGTSGSSAGGLDLGGADSGGMAGDGGAPNAALCDGCSPEECCDGVCANLAFDPKNCRA